MVAKRIIPCLDVNCGRTVKGVNFDNMIDIGSPIDLARAYSQQGADELLFLDINATKDNSNIFYKIIEEIACNINIPFTVGGGVRSVDDVARLLDSGADKVAINSAAIYNPNLVNKVSSRFGNQILVIAIDTKKLDDRQVVFSAGASKSCEKELLEWSIEVQDRGAGEILYTSIDCDGMVNGYDLENLKILNDRLRIPLIASGGAGSMDHFLELFRLDCSSAALAASVFHKEVIKIKELKSYLFKNSIDIRLC